MQRTRVYSADQKVTSTLSPLQEAAPPSAASTESRIWFAQMLRAVAVALVVFEHLGLGFWANPANQARFHFWTGPIWVSPLLNFTGTSKIMFGAVGVAIFFLISGFVIPFSLNKFRPLGFLVARWFRIFPTYAAALTLICLILSITSGHTLTTLIKCSQQYLWSLSLIGEYFSKPPIEVVVWTLRIELVFYVVCAVVSAFASLKSFRAIATVAICLAATNSLIAYLCTQYTVPVNFFIGMTNMTIFVSCLLFMFVGTCFYNYFEKHWTLSQFRTLAITCFLLSVGVMASHRDHEELGIPFGIAFTVATFVFGTVFYYRDRFKFDRITNFLANISYPLYLMHCTAGTALLGCFLKYTHNQYTSLLFAVSVLISLSYLLHISVELPSNEFGKRLVKKHFPQA